MKRIAIKKGESVEVVLGGATLLCLSCDEETEPQVSGELSEKVLVSGVSSPPTAELSKVVFGDVGLAEKVKIRFEEFFELIRSADGRSQIEEKHLAEEMVRLILEEREACAQACEAQTLLSPATGNYFAELIRRTR